MAPEFVKAYQNFLKFEEEREMSRNLSDKSRSNSGLLAPRASRRTEQASGYSELDKVADYVQRIRGHRMRLKNGE